MKFAYADPPYMGQAKKHYGSESEVDMLELIKNMTEDFPDGWALSMSSPSIFKIAPMCPDGTRLGAWTKPFCSFKPGVNPAFAWEPVAFFRGRKRTRALPTLRDWVSANITMKKGMSGVKPKEFCFWVFDWLNVQEGDEFIDLFPGSGAVSRALEDYMETKQEARL